MKRIKRIIAMLCLALLLASPAMQAASPGSIVRNFKPIKVGPFSAGHVQGIAVDARHGWIYYSFTTMLVKTDFQGNVLGTVDGFIGHLGCLAFNEADGCVYGSLEYKDDEIGRGIQRMTGTAQEFANSFYIVIFDGSKINRTGMTMASGVMRAACLPTVASDYNATVNGRKHRYGCSGIDGVTFGPAFGHASGRKFLTVAYGIFADTSRTDNDYQVLLQYDAAALKRLAKPLTQDHLHRSGPARPHGTYFAYTGNTSWGVQNLAYDSFTGNWMMAVYPGTKPRFQNHNFYLVDGKARPAMQRLKGHDGERGRVLSLVRDGIYDSRNGTWGWDSPFGGTGLAPLGNGYYLTAYSSRRNGGECATLRLAQWTGFTPCPFRLLPKPPHILAKH